VKNKNISLFALLAAALILFFVKNNQKGSKTNIKDRVTVENATDAYTQLRGGNKTISYSRHAKCRMECRHIDESEVKEILQKGEINFSKEKESEKGVTYPLEGVTHDGQHVRIVFAPHDNTVTVVTAIDLDTNWPCGDCK
jgi:acetylornithine deacetylase/succinyl-diaminopimelate desuccinylase-like protein